MDNFVTLKEYEERWKLLLRRAKSPGCAPLPNSARRWTRTAAPKSTTKRKGPKRRRTTRYGLDDENNRDDGDDDDECDASEEAGRDPFDCSSLAIPPTHGLVDRVVDDYVERWRALDSRKVVRSDDMDAVPFQDGDDDNDTDNEDNDEGDGDGNNDCADDNNNNNNSNDGEKCQRDSSTSGDCGGGDGDGDGDRDRDGDGDGKGSRTASSVPRRRRRRQQQQQRQQQLRSASLPHWHENHVRLPEKFDYATRLPAPPAAEADDDRVVSLVDPTQRLSYHQELWKLFRSVPTVEELEEKASGGARLHHTAAVYEEIKEGSERHKRMDGHALSRLRMSDRHDLPPSLVVANNGGGAAAESSTTAAGTVCFEFWKRQPRRGSTPDPNRAVVEFLGSQTLYDVHKVLVELTEDELWTSSWPGKDDALQVAAASDRNASGRTTDLRGRNCGEEHDGIDDDNDSNNNDNDNENNDSSSQSNNSSSKLNNDKNANRKEDDNGDSDGVKNNNRHGNHANKGEDGPSSCSGYFFIENTFYVAGSVDYTTAILKWLRQGGPRQRDRRAAHLGLPPVAEGGCGEGSDGPPPPPSSSSSSLPAVRSMDGVRLDEISFRLAVRYVHVHNGDVECSVFAVDRRLLRFDDGNDDGQRRRGRSTFPILYDVWTPPGNHPHCDACRDRPAVVATSTECAETRGHRVLCELCCRQLKLCLNRPEHVQRYSVWRNQVDLSMGASQEPCF